MPTTLYAHLTWTTFGRASLITPDIAAFLHDFLPRQAQRYHAKVLELGMVQDHVHVVLWLDRECDVPRLAQALKGASSRIANRDGFAPPDAPLRWASGYDLRSVSPRALVRVQQYVRDQGRRHPLDRVGRVEG